MKKNKKFGGPVMTPHFILASSSPRRKELLASIGLEYDVVVPDADESAVSRDGITPELYVQELALIKAAAAAKLVLKDKNAVIIAADTVVSNNGEILGKPEDAEDAFNMLSSLSGHKHTVYTGCCVMSVRSGKTVCRTSSADVYFKELSADKIWRYIATGEPADKAGAYGIQGIGGTLVEKTDGDYQSVVGLGISSLSDILENEFNINIF